MAVGLAKYMGINLINNFNLLYIAKNPSDFWRRWHISLSTWFRDYVYFPLGGSKGGFKSFIIATMTTFVLSAIWHGAGYGFIIWGFYHGLLLIIYRMIKDKYDAISQPLMIPLNFLLMTFGWIFFRAGVNTGSLKKISTLFPQSAFEYEKVATYIVILIIVYSLHFIEKTIPYHKVRKALTYLTCSLYVLIAFIAVLVSGDVQKFIYFQF